MNLQKKVSNCQIRLEKCSDRTRRAFTEDAARRLFFLARDSDDEIKPLAPANPLFLGSRKRRWNKKNLFLSYGKQQAVRTKKKIVVVVFIVTVSSLVNELAIALILIPQMPPSNSLPCCGCCYVGVSQFATCVSPIVDKTAPVWRFDYRFSSAAAWFISDGEKLPPFKRGRKGPCGTLLSRSTTTVHYSTPPNFYLWNRKTSRAKIMVFFASSSSETKSTETLGVV